MIQWFMMGFYGESVITRNRPTETSWEIGIRIACDVVVLVCFSMF